MDEKFNPNYPHARFIPFSVGGARSGQELITNGQIQPSMEYELQSCLIFVVKGHPACIDQLQYSIDLS